MNKKHFSKYIADNLNISKLQANILIDTFTTNLNQAIFEGYTVSIDNFGSFIPINDVRKTPGQNQTIKFISNSQVKDNKIQHNKAS